MSAAERTPIIDLNAMDLAYWITVVARPHLSRIANSFFAIFCAVFSARLSGNGYFFLCFLLTGGISFLLDCLFKRFEELVKRRHPVFPLKSLDGRHHFFGRLGVGITQVVH